MLRSLRPCVIVANKWDLAVDHMEIPDFDKPTVSRSSRAEAHQSVFGAVDSMVNQRFAADARRIAASLSLPVVSLPSITG